MHKNRDATGGVQGPHSIPWIPEEPKGRGMTSEGDQRNVLTPGHFLVRRNLKIVGKNAILFSSNMLVKNKLIFLKR